MSEPQTSAKVVFHTTKGRLDVEFWAREKPLHAKRFLEICYGGSLNDESLCGLSKDRGCILVSKVPSEQKLPAEHNARIRFNRAGIFGWDCRRLNWFISLRALSEDDEKIALGKVVDQSIYSLRKIVDESELNSENQFLYPAIIRRAEVTIPFFSDLKPTTANESHSTSLGTPVVRAAKVRISYGDDEDEENDEGSMPVKRMKIKLPAVLAKPEPKTSSSGECGAESKATRSETAVEVDGNEGSEDDDGAEAIESDKDVQDSPEKVAEDSQRRVADNQNVNSREQDTLRMLALFQQNVKGKNIINRPRDR